MGNYLVCYTQIGYKPELGQARRLNEEEKTHYAPWFHDIGFVGVGESLELEHLNQFDVEKFLQREKSDGQFISSSDNVYIISQDEWDKLLELENNKKELADQIDKDKKIDELQKIICQCAAAGKLYTKEEAAKKRREYNNLYNEGGCGFIPHFWTVDEYEDAKKELHKLLSD